MLDLHMSSCVNPTSVKVLPCIYDISFFYLLINLFVHFTFYILESILIHSENCFAVNGQSELHLC